jgi:hypothetical protein
MPFIKLSFKELNILYNQDASLAICSLNYIIINYLKNSLIISKRVIRFSIIIKKNSLLIKIEYSRRRPF